jgi:tetratricopeptide (TPR) repeat protein
LWEWLVTDWWEWLLAALSSGDPERVTSALAAIIAIGGVLLGLVMPKPWRWRSARQAQREHRAYTEHVISQTVQQVLAAQGGTPMPGQAEAVGSAIRSAEADAEAGDPRMKKALSLLEKGAIQAAAPLFRDVAEAKMTEALVSGKEAAKAWRHLGAIAGFGDPKTALEAYEKAAQLDPDDAATFMWLGRLLLQSGHLDQAQEAAQKALSQARDDDQEAKYWANFVLGDIALERGRGGAAKQFYHRAQNNILKQCAADPQNLTWQRDLAVSYERIGDRYAAQGKPDEAEKAHNEALTITKRLTDADPQNLTWQRDLAVSYNRIGTLYAAQGKPDEAEKAFHQALTITKRLTKADPQNLTWQRDLAFSYSQIGDRYAAQGKPKKAEANLRAANECWAKIADMDQSNAFPEAITRRDAALQRAEAIKKDQQT